MHFRTLWLPDLAGQSPACLRIWGREIWGAEGGKPGSQARLADLVVEGFPGREVSRPRPSTFS